MKLKVLIFFISGLLVSACGYKLPDMKAADNSTNSVAQTNQNAKNQSSENKAGTNAEAVNKNSTVSNTESDDTGGGKLILSGTGEAATHPCGGREVEVKETATSSTYTLTGECKKLTVDGVSNKIKVDKVGEISAAGVSNIVTYGEGIGGKKPKITISKSGTSLTVESKAEAEKKESEAKQK